MIKAKDLFRRPDMPTQDEVARLKDLAARIPNETKDSRKALGHELLEILNNRGEALNHRVLAGFIISAHAADLELVGSSPASSALTKLVRSEFFAGNQKYGFLRKKADRTALSCNICASRRLALRFSRDRGP